MAYRVLTAPSPRWKKYDDTVQGPQKATCSMTDTDHQLRGIVSDLEKTDATYYQIVNF